MSLQDPGPLLVLGLIQVPIIFGRLMLSTQKLRSTVYGKFTALREKQICSTIISWSEAKRIQCVANAGIHLRLAALSRLHSECTCVAGPKVGRVFAVEKHFFLRALLLLPTFVIFSARMPLFWYFPPPLFLRSFFLLCAVHRPAEKLLKRWYYLALCTRRSLTAAFLLYLKFLEVVIFNNVYTKLC